MPLASLTVPLYAATPDCGLGWSKNGVTVEKFRCCIMAVRYWLTFCAAAVVVTAALVLALGAGVGDGAVGLYTLQQGPLQTSPPLTSLLRMISSW